MLLLRAEQWDQLTVAAEQAFHRRARDWLLDLYPDELAAIPPGALDQLITDGIRRSRAYGLDGEDEVLFFLELIAELGENFEHRSEHLRALTLLEDDELEALEKIQALADYKTFELRE